MNFNEFDFERGPKRLDPNQDKFFLSSKVDGTYFGCAYCLPPEKSTL